MRLEPRTGASLAVHLLAPLGALAVTLAIAALLVMWSGASALGTFALVLKGAAGSQFALLETLTRSTPLTTGSPPRRLRQAWNIGGEALYHAVSPAMLGTGLLPLPAPLLVILLLAGAIGGACLLADAARTASRRRVVTTLLLNLSSCCSSAALTGVGPDGWAGRSRRR
jgi:simple sugar transport system permease protein